MDYSANLPYSEDDSNTRMPATGDLGLRAESMAAKNVFEQTVVRDSAVQQDPQLKSALESLRGIMNQTHPDVTDPSRGLTATSLAKCASEASLPDWEQVRALLKRAESSLTTWFDTMVHPC